MAEVHVEAEVMAEATMAEAEAGEGELISKPVQLLIIMRIGYHSGVAYL